MSSSSIWSIVPGATISDQYGPGSNGIEQDPTFPKAPIMGPHHQIVEGFYPFAEMLSVYSAALDDWGLCVRMCV